MEWRALNGLILRARVMLSFKRNDGDEFLPAAHSSFANITKDSPVEEQLRKGSYRLDNGKVVTCPVIYMGIMQPR